MDKRTEQLMEDFYSVLEAGLPGYKRPADYKARFLRSQLKHRNPVKNQVEGRSGR